MIRNATLEDINQLAHLFDGYRVFYKKDPNIGAAKEFLRKRLEEQDSYIYIAEENGKLVGFTQLYPLFSSTRMQKLFLLNDLFVNVEYRGKGYSKALIQRAKQLAEEKGACGIMLETEKSNIIGNGLYPSTGFVLNEGSNYYEWTNSISHD